jgi:hypothetical protein
LIKAGSCIPWVAAFTKWCLNIEPSIFLENGIKIVDQPQSPVVITASKDGFQVTIHYAVGGPKELAMSVTGIQGPICGMANLKNYGKYLLMECNLDFGDGEGAIKEALPHAISQVIEFIRFSTYK